MPKTWSGREGSRFPRLPAACGLALALAGSGCTTDQACQEALALRQPSAPPLRCDSAGCAQIEREPQRVVRFSFWLVKQEMNDRGFYESYPLEKKIRNWECVAGLLRPSGAVIQARDELNDVNVVGTHEQVKNAYELASVHTVSVDCGSEGLCPECRSKAEPECAADRLCYVHFVAGEAQCSPSGHPQPAAAQVPTSTRPETSTRSIDGARPEDPRAP